MNIALIVVMAYLSATVALLVLSARATSGIVWTTHKRKARPAIARNMAHRPTGECADVAQPRGDAAPPTPALAEWQSERGRP